MLSRSIGSYFTIDGIESCAAQRFACNIRLWPWVYNCKYMCCVYACMPMCIIRKTINITFFGAQAHKSVTFIIFLRL